MELLKQQNELKAQLGAHRATEAQKARQAQATEDAAASGVGSWDAVTVARGEHAQATAARVEVEKQHEAVSRRLLRGPGARGPAPILAPSNGRYTFEGENDVPAFVQPRSTAEQIVRDNGRRTVAPSPILAQPPADPEPQAQPDQALEPAAQVGRTYAWQDEQDVPMTPQPPRRNRQRR